MEGTTNKSRTIERPRYNRLSLTWIDFLVIAAIILTFAAIVSTTLGRARAASAERLRTIAPSVELSQAPDADPGLIKARIRLAGGGPWG